MMQFSVMYLPKQSKLWEVMTMVGTFSMQQFVFHVKQHTAGFSENKVLAYPIIDIQVAIPSSHWFWIFYECMEGKQIG